MLKKYLLSFKTFWQSMKVFFRLLLSSCRYLWKYSTAETYVLVKSMHHVLVDQMRLALDRCDEKKRKISRTNTTAIGTLTPIIMLILLSLWKDSFSCWAILLINNVVLDDGDWKILVKLGASLDFLVLFISLDFLT